MLSQLREDLKRKGSPQKSKVYQGFFKTGKGEYGEGDVFLGVTVPDTRAIAQKYSDLGFEGIKRLLQSKIHEERLVAVLLLVHNFKKGTPKEQKAIYNFYLSSTRYINNWDLIDLSADKIVGEYVFGNPKQKAILSRFAKSRNLWERRIAIIATFQFIKHGEFEETLKVAEILLEDTHDLIHKAVGWMLREVGNRSQETEEKFLRKHYKQMPRTMLRYAIERFPEQLRKAYLGGTI